MDLHSNQTLPPGTSVEVFSSFSSSWIGGFEIAPSLDDRFDDRYDRYELRRISDRTVLPTSFPVDDIRVDTSSAMSSLAEDDPTGAALGDVSRREVHHEAD
jgi:hypothetical protein